MGDAKQTVPQPTEVSTDEGWMVYVLLFNGDEGGAACGGHPLQQTQFVVLSREDGSGAMRLPGGAWSRALDGANPEGSALERAAARHVKAQLNVDLTGCVFHKFFTAVFETCRAVVLVPNVWTLQPFVAHRQVREETVEYEAMKTFDEELSAEEVKVHVGKINAALDKERATARGLERETDRMDRLAELDERFIKMKADIPKTKPVQRAVTLSRIETHVTTRPMLLSFQDIMHWDASAQELEFLVQLSAVTFEELLGYESGQQVTRWIQQYAADWKAKDQKASAKRKRCADERVEHEQLMEEHGAKRRKLQQQIRDLGAQTASIEREIANAQKESLKAEKELILQEYQTKASELTALADAPGPVPPSTVAVCDKLNAQQAGPFQYFDFVGSGKVSHQVLEGVLVGSGLLCQREVQTLGDVLTWPVPGCEKPEDASVFDYHAACSQPDN
eukprot:NODE_654_length_1460_cov_96.621545_g489_i0.p1 GENE.NODE_654_length_1460_cov_96.621545_g489_i0~~NODE_654_length_1460_cov_96.621545_g489_i0.p1  ORF type:complete len:448 (-),score=123.40 NODE_654_length_1460_cov_96.621545_g489_i0:90-1433(-)